MEWTNITKSKLLKDLKRFGLNPQEWEITTQWIGDKQPQVLCHKVDKGFSLLGIPLQNGTLFRWEELQVLSV